MSDSEFESIVAGASCSTKGAKSTQAKQKRKSNSSRSDSEFETIDEAVVKKQKVKKPSTSRANRSTTTVSKKKAATSEFDVFGLFPDDEALARSSSASASLDSCVVQRIANGITKRMTSLDGEFYLDLKVYKTGDIHSELPEERWKKAILSVKAQLDVDTSQWNHLEKFITDLKILFNDSEVKYYPSKKTK